MMQKYLSGFSKHLLKLPILLMIVCAIVLTMHINRQEGDKLSYLTPEQIYRFSLTIFFEPDGEIEVKTFLPTTNERQEILDEAIVAKNTNVHNVNNDSGRTVIWYGDSAARQINYSALLSLKEIRYALSPNLNIPRNVDKTLLPYLAETEFVPVQHPEIIALWDQIKPNDPGNAYQVLQAIYDYTYKNITPLPFKGLTDSLTALRLGAASCNGKSRLFVSLARLNGLPARLVGGVILDGAKKKTSHQWVEVFLQGHWVPFDVTNGYFAYLPKYYLELYRGDQVLFKHTANINFDYYFTSSGQSIARALYKDEQPASVFIPNAAKLIQDLGLPIKATYVFLLFPFCALIITFLRNVIGVKTFGTFMPMLIAASCVYTGLLTGLMGFVTVIAIAYLGHTIMGKFHVLKIPRLATIITLISIITLTGISFIDQPIGIETGVVILFPAVVISFTADKMHDLTDERNWRELMTSSLGTLATILICYLAFESIVLQGVFALYPELLIAVLAALLYIGSWSGMRITELKRFRNIIDNNTGKVMGINQRNRDLIYKLNDKVLLLLAADKLRTKEALSSFDIPVPETVARCSHYSEIDDFLEQMMQHSNVVIKPNKGSRGNGIIVLRERSGDGFLTASGEFISMAKIKNHVTQILSGNFSQSGKEDDVYLERAIQQNDFLQRISERGLCDIRVLVVQGKIVTAMLRVPTKETHGKANLHQGAIGVAIDMETGITTRASIKGKSITHHPDSQMPLVELQIPYWPEIRDIAMRCYLAVPLGYMGVDICLGVNGPLVLEVNGRPGIEIQNIQNTGLAQQVQGAL